MTTPSSSSILSLNLTPASAIQALRCPALYAYRNLAGFRGLMANLPPDPTPSHIDTQTGKLSFEPPTAADKAYMALMKARETTSLRDAALSAHLSKHLAFEPDPATLAFPLHHPPYGVTWTAPLQWSKAREAHALVHHVPTGISLDAAARALPFDLSVALSLHVLEDSRTNLQSGYSLPDDQLLIVLAKAPTIKRTKDLAQPQAYSAALFASLVADPELCVRILPWSIEGELFQNIDGPSRMNTAQIVGYLTKSLTEMAANSEYPAIRAHGCADVAPHPCEYRNLCWYGSTERYMADEQQIGMGFNE